MEIVHKMYVSYGKGRKFALSESQRFIVIQLSSCLAILLGSFSFLLLISVVANQVSQGSPEALPGPGSVAMRLMESVWTLSSDSSYFTSPTQDFPSVSVRQMEKAEQTMTEAVILSPGGSGLHGLFADELDSYVWEDML